MFPLLPIRLLCRYRYDNESAIRKVHCPVLMAHGPDDVTVPYALGRRVYAAANEPKRFVSLEGGHNDGGLDVDLEFRAVFKAWVEKYVGGEHCRADDSGV
jgi:fermentation-respiration switch protein FrsA (DUF1100 family)